ncbi:MAG: DUF4263 domain-containing protein [Anaerolineae bacterium]|nr:DUF4263 domain-containing protein [Anaerolineae bacterium]
MPENLGSHKMTLDEAMDKAIKINSRRFDADQQPDLSGVKICVLKEGRYVKKVAKYWKIRSRKSGAEKHGQLVLYTLRCTKARGWEWEDEHTITLTEEDGDEVAKLFSFLAGLPGVEGEGEYIVVNAQNIDSDRFGQVLAAVASSDRKIGLIEQILSWVNEDPRVTGGLIRLASDNPERTKALVAALNYARYSRAISDFQDLIDEDHPERVYQRFLEENDWMFGSEYSELLPKRELARGLELDFPLRRTVDGYLEIIEIKRPLNGVLLFIGSEHPYPRTEVTQAISQARNYLTRLDANKYMIQSEDELVVDKVRAKVVIGRSGNEAQKLALRSENAHQERVEIITYDQLIAIARRVLDIMVAKNPYLQDIDLDEQAGSEIIPDTEGAEDLPF